MVANTSSRRQFAIRSFGSRTCALIRPGAKTVDFRSRRRGSNGDHDRQRLQQAREASRAAFLIRAISSDVSIRDAVCGGRVWSQSGSNRRPLECHSSALPAELWPLGIGNRVLAVGGRLCQPICTSAPARLADSVNRVCFHGEDRHEGGLPTFSPMQDASRSSVLRVILATTASASGVPHAGASASAPDADRRRLCLARVADDVDPGGRG